MSVKDAGRSAILIIPAHNEANSLLNVLSRLKAAGFGGRCVVIDDGSSDDTEGVARDAGATVIRHPFNLGYGAALQTGYKYAVSQNAELVVQMDADGQHEPDDVSRLIERLRETGCNLVIGSRFLVSTGYTMGPMRNLGRQLFRGVGKLFSIDVRDPTSGFQCMDRRTLALYVSDFFPSDFPDIDVLVMAHRHKLRIMECPVKMRESMRKSQIHFGLRPIYYVYKMLLSLLATTSGKIR